MLCFVTVHLPSGCYLHSSVVSEAVPLFDRSGFDLTFWPLEEGRSPRVHEDTLHTPVLQCCSMKLLRYTVDLHLISDMVTNIA